MTHVRITICLPLEGCDPESAGELLIEAGAGSTECILSSEQATPHRLRVFCDHTNLLQVLASVDRLGGTILEQSTIAEQDWTALCPELHQPMVVGGLVIQPHASPVGITPEPGVLHIIPGMGFGTGHHDTTNTLIAMLGALASEGRKIFTVADIGTGSGILAIAASMLFPDAEVIATDIDSAALENAAENCAMNGVTPKITLSLTSLPDLTSPRDLVIANLYAELLIEMRHDLVTLARPDGILLISGIAVELEPAIETAFSDLPLTLEYRWESPARADDNHGMRWVARRYRRTVTSASLGDTHEGTRL